MPFWFLMLQDLSAMMVTHVAVRATLILASAGILAAALTRASAAARHVAWAAGFGALIALPLIPEITPFWSLPIIPGRALGYDVGSLVRDASTVTGCCASPFVTVGSILLLTWAAGALAMTAGLALSILTLHRITATARFPSGDRVARAARRAFAGRVGRRAVRIVMSDRVRAPVVWGLLRPVIILPRESVEWTDGRLDAVLRHELAHVRRWDWAGAMIMELARSMYWPNPLVWFASRRLRLEQEHACDDEVIRSGISPTAYARHLLEIARGMVAGAPLPHAPLPRAALPVARGSTLRSRVQRILDASSDRRPLTRSALIIALLLLAPIVPAFAGLNAWRCPAAANQRLNRSPIDPSEAFTPPVAPSFAASAVAF